MLNHQLPSDGQDFVIQGHAVLQYAGLLTGLFPQIRTEFTIVNQVATCGIAHGVFDARLYVAHDLRAAAAVIIVTGKNAAQMHDVATNCFHRNLAIDGPRTSSIYPVALSFKYSIGSLAYYVLVAATNEPTYKNFEVAFDEYSPEFF